MGNDLVRFIQGVIGRPTIVSGLSSGGVLSAWLSAYAPPGLVRAAHYEDPPLFGSETTPAYGHSIKQSIGPMFALWSKYLGDQWSVGNWAGMVANAETESAALDGDDASQGRRTAPEPERVRPGVGTRLLERNRRGELRPRADARRREGPGALHPPFRHVDEATGFVMGAISDLQAGKVRELVEGAGQPFDYRSFPQMGHSMHGQDPQLFAKTLTEWALALAPVG